MICMEKSTTTWNCGSSSKRVVIASANTVTARFLRIFTTIVVMNSSRGRTREVDFVADPGGRLEMLEAKWSEVPAASDTVNLEFMRSVVGASRVGSGAIVCRTPNSFPR